MAACGPYLKSLSREAICRSTGRGGVAHTVSPGVCSTGLALHVGDRGLTFSRMRLRVTEAILIACSCPSESSRKWEVAQISRRRSSGPPVVQAQCLCPQLH